MDSIGGLNYMWVRRIITATYTERKMFRSVTVISACLRVKPPTLPPVYSRPSRLWRVWTLKQSNSSDNRWSPHVQVDLAARRWLEGLMSATVANTIRLDVKVTWILETVISTCSITMD
ncbi:hypothetical protein J6590_013455 [Homalodisca vitripennis]|nr:hypothetical protein J6590_013455 [Homalodisca vitripennis]